MGRCPSPPPKGIPFGIPSREGWMQEQSLAYPSFHAMAMPLHGKHPLLIRKQIKRGELSSIFPYFSHGEDFKGGYPWAEVVSKIHLN